jgi:hypothetical protein
MKKQPIGKMKYVIIATLVEKKTKIHPNLKITHIGKYS